MATKKELLQAENENLSEDTLEGTPKGLTKKKI